MGLINNFIKLFHYLNKINAIKIYVLISKNYKSCSLISQINKFFTCFLVYIYQSNCAN